MYFAHMYSIEFECILISQVPQPTSQSQAGTLSNFDQMYSNEFEYILILCILMNLNAF